MKEFKITIKDMALMSMLAALTAILSQISIPLPLIPINFALLSVFIAGGLLGPVKGSISQLVYVLLGAVGLPVFGEFSGGVGIITGPTGGYIIGYIIAAFVIGLLTSKVKLFGNVRGYSAAMIIGFLCCYAVGTLWFMRVMETGLAESLAMCVLPYIPGDLIKTGIAALSVKRLERFVKK